MLLPPEKGNVVSTGHTLQRLGPKWSVMPVFRSTHKKSTFQPKNRPRIAEGVKTSLHIWCIYYIDRVYISRFSKFRGLWQKSKEDIFLVNNKCINTMIILVSPQSQNPYLGEHVYNFVRGLPGLQNYEFKFPLKCVGVEKIIKHYMN